MPWPRSEPRPPYDKSNLLTTNPAYLPDEIWLPGRKVPMRQCQSVLDWGIWHINAPDAKWSVFPSKVDQFTADVSASCILRPCTSTSLFQGLSCSFPSCMAVWLVNAVLYYTVQFCVLTVSIWLVLQVWRLSFYLLWQLLWRHIVLIYTYLQGTKIVPLQVCNV